MTLKLGTRQAGCGRMWGAKEGRAASRVWSGGPR
jgi:hypothetical protein